MATTRRSAAAPATPAGIRRWHVATLAGLAAAVAVAVWLLWPRENKLAAVESLQKQILATAGTPARSDITRVMQTVDRMDRREVWAAYRMAGEEWKRIKQEAVDDYFSASPEERPPLLDAQIERLVSYHDLLQAMNPGERPGATAYLPRQGRGRGEPRVKPTRAEVDAEKARRELAARFDEAVEARAKARRITLPAFR